jgi:hypothetical protein
MDGAISTLLVLGLMATVVLLFRRFVRRPARVSQDDPPGVRTMVAFSGTDPELFQDDTEERPLVGVRLFRMLCDGLAEDQVAVTSRGTIQNAQRAECVVGIERFALVLEWIDQTWVASVEWVPTTAPEKRHLALTQQVFAPPDSPALRRLLSALDHWLKAQPELADVRWYRKEQWIAEDTSDPSEVPVS